MSKGGIYFSHLPKSWSCVPLVDCIKKITDGSHFTPKYVSEGYPFITISNLANDSIDFSNAKTISQADYDKLKGNCNPHKNDVLFSKDGTVGKVIEINFEKHFIVLSSLAIIRPYLNLTFPSYLRYLLQSKVILDQAAKLKTGTALTRIILRNLKKVRIPIPPLPEQHRIVAKIEELFTKLDAGVEALKQVRVQLKRYRQSVLKAAVEGKLTAGWRERHKDELEPADKLLESIRIEQKAKLGKRYKEMEQVDTSDLPRLPEEWDWKSFSHIGELNRGKSKHRPRNDPELYNGDYPFVQTGDIRNANKFVRSYSQTYNEIGLKQSRLWPKGTLCITIAANIADTAILDFEACFPDSIVGFSLNQSCNIFFIEYFLRTAKENLNRYAPATAQKNINLKILSELLIPLPPKIEQDKIVEELDRIFSVADQLDSIIENELKRAQSLRQSILKRSFEGKLVPQDPNDEPASVLLERIKDEKAKTKKSKRMEML